MKDKKEDTFFTKFLKEIATAQINKSEEPRVGLSGTSVYASHSEIIKSAKEDKIELKKIFQKKSGK